MEYKRVSFIMSVYNSNLCMLKKTIQSVQNQEYENFELIIMINSPENEELCSFLRTYQESDNRIKVYENKKNLGLALSLNEACKKATGVYLARIDADDINLPERLKRQVEYIEENSFDIIGTGITYIDEKDELIPDMKFHYYSNSVVEKVLNYIDCIPHPTWLVKKTVFDTIGKYRDIDYCEDYDFLLRAKKYGFKIGLMPEELLCYRISRQSLSQTKAAQQLLASWLLSKNRNKISEFSSNEIRSVVTKELESTSFIESFEKTRDRIRSYAGSNIAIRSFALGYGALTSKAYRIILKKIIISKIYRLVSALRK